MNIGKSISGALSYNENKVSAGKAEILLASGFSTDISDLSFTSKLKRFNLLIDRNRYVQNNTLHLSINFAPGEILTDITLQDIARDYMERIGFEKQPYIVYRHDDSSHPHIHIVTTSIKDNARQIKMHNIALDKSEPARKAIEIEYGLVRAEDRKKERNLGVPPAEINAAVYSRYETKRQITNILGEVLARYPFRNLEELNAVLTHFKVYAQKVEDTTGGLVYGILDKMGYKTGIPIKASSIYGKPTLKELSKRFAKNEVKGLAKKPYAAARINESIQRSKDIPQFLESCNKKDISLQVQRTSGMAISNIIFVDHRQKATIDLRDLGMTPIEFTERITPIKKEQESQGKKEHLEDSTTEAEKLIEISSLGNISGSIIDILLANQSGGTGSGMPLPKKKKRKKKRQI